MEHVWVVYNVPSDCQCWRDALCPHGWTWQENPDDQCRHMESFESVYESFADAVRSFFSWDGKRAIGRLLRVKWGMFPDFRGTREVYLMPSGAGPLVDNHEGYVDVTPLAVIAHYRFVPRSSPKNDPDGTRKIAAEYANVEPVGSAK